MSTYLVTGTAGFIGYHLALRLLKQGVDVVGIDIVNDYYDVQLKRDRLAQLLDFDNFTSIESDLANTDAVMDVFRKHDFSRVVHRI